VDLLEGEASSRRGPDWIGIGYITADLGALLILITLIVTGIANRRLRGADGGTSVLARREHRADVDHPRGLHRGDVGHER
jgi:hypothetical protein